jgi:endonuclease/exonuclease/phosphatase family metal-dependent hydrolase
MTLRLATLNIWNRFGPWEKRLVAIQRQLALLDPDIIGLQEVLRSTQGDALDQAALLASARGDHIAFGVASEEHGFPVGNAILSRWPIARSSVHELPRLGSDQKRSLVFAEIDSPHGKIPFFVTHLNWRFHEGIVRQAQVLRIAEVIAELAPIGGFPPILVGDFNAAPDADEVRFLRGLCAIGGKTVYFADCFEIAGDGSLGATYSRTKNPFAAPLREPDRRIDYVFVRGPDDRGRGEPLEARVCFDQPTDDVYPSDHFGVVATVSTSGQT